MPIGKLKITGKLPAKLRKALEALVEITDGDDYVAVLDATPVGEGCQAAHALGRPSFYMAQFAKSTSPYLPTVWVCYTWEEAQQVAGPCSLRLVLDEMKEDEAARQLLLALDRVKISPAEPCLIPEVGL